VEVIWTTSLTHFHSCRSHRCRTGTKDPRSRHPSPATRQPSLNRAGLERAAGVGAEVVGKPAAALWAADYNGPANGDDLATAIAASPHGTKLYVTGSSPGNDIYARGWPLNSGMHSCC
jgi:hypothetical protein